MSDLHSVSFACLLALALSLLYRLESTMVVLAIHYSSRGSIPLYLESMANIFCVTSQFDSEERSVIQTKF